MTTSLDSEGVFCNAEWHLRANPYAIGIYALAMHLTKGGERVFYLSQPQVAAYYGWNVKTVKKAFKVLRAAGLFVLVKNGVGGTGKGNFASVYRVVKHSELKTGNCRSTGPLHSIDRPILGQATGPSDGPLVSTQSPQQSPSPSLSDGFTSSASPLEGKTNGNPAPLPQTFRPDLNNEQFATQNGLNLEEELAAFSDLHLSIGNERKNWQSVFRKHLELPPPCEAAWPCRTGFPARNGPHISTCVNALVEA